VHVTSDWIIGAVKSFMFSS